MGQDAFAEFKRKFYPPEPAPSDGDSEGPSWASEAGTLAWSNPEKYGTELGERLLKTFDQTVSEDLTALPKE